MTLIDETKSTYNGREVYAQTTSDGRCAGCALEREPDAAPCRAVGPCDPSNRADNSHIIWVYADE